MKNIQQKLPWLCLESTVLLCAVFGYFYYQSFENQFEFEVLLLGDPRLRKTSEHVTLELLNSEHFKQNSTNLVCMLHQFREKHGFGRAIAAPQIGIRFVFVTQIRNKTVKSTNKD